MVRLCTDSMTTPAHSINKRQALPIPGQVEALQVNNEPDETPRWSYEKPARQQVPSQRQAAVHTTTPFPTTRPPEGQKRDGPIILVAGH